MKKTLSAILLAIFLLAVCGTPIALAVGGTSLTGGAAAIAGTNYAANAAAAHASGLTTTLANTAASGALSNYATSFSQPANPSIPFINQGTGNSQYLSNGMQVSYTGEGTYWVPGLSTTFTNPINGNPVTVGLGYSYVTGVTDSGAQFLQTNAIGTFLATLGYGPAAGMDMGFSSLLDVSAAAQATMLSMATNGDWQGLADFLNPMSAFSDAQDAVTRLSLYDMVALVSAANVFADNPNWMSALFFAENPWAPGVTPEIPFIIPGLEWLFAPPDWWPDDVPWPWESPVPEETPLPTPGPETPVPTVPPAQTPTTPPIPECPDPELILNPPSFGEITIQPPYPIVVGQDPEQRGVDFIIPAYGGSATWRWWELIVVIDAWHEECEDRYIADEDRWVERCRRVIDEWHWECKAFQETYEDPVAEIGAKVELDAGSIAWIEGEMEQRFPGAHVYGSYPIGLSGHSVGLGSMEATFYASRIQLRDPGLYHMNARVNTTGTPISAPQTARTEEDFDVWLRDESLTY